MVGAVAVAAIGSRPEGRGCWAGYGVVSRGIGDGQYSCEPRLRGGADEGGEDEAIGYEEAG